MGKVSLAVKYRPKTFEDVCGQKAIIDILKNQVETGEFPPVTILSGPSGTGKTTTARIVGSLINKTDQYDYREFDAAANNGVEDAEKIITEARQKSIISPTKILVLDECHMLTKQAQSKFLKIFEDCPKHTIFFLCTTDPQNILPTIVSRSQVFKLTKIPTQEISNRLKFICDEEKKTNPAINYDQKALDYIAKLADGGARLAISMLDTCISLDPNITIESASKALGVSDITFNTELFRNLYNFRFTTTDENEKLKSQKYCIELIENLYNGGKDLKQFLNQFINFTLDISKYLLFNKSFVNTQLPPTEQLSKELEGYELSKVKQILNQLVLFKDRTKFENSLLVPFESFILS